MDKAATFDNLQNLPIGGTSFRNNVWKLKTPDGALLQEYIRKGISDLEARIIHNRGANPDDVENIINPRLKNQLVDPLKLLGMGDAINAIIDAIIAKQEILIFADYDVDGGTSAAILTAWFKAIGAKTKIFVPDRIKDGYGPSPRLMNNIKALGTNLLICVDCGAAAFEAFEQAHKIGLNIVVFDHHLMGESVPHALALVNPNHPHDETNLGNLTAAGVCFMAVIGLNREWKNRGFKSDFDALQILDLATLGTVCDVAPLVGLNRAIVYQGQKILAKKQRIGLKALGDVAGLKKAGNVFAAAWVYGPRLNAGGRIGNSSLCVDLLTTEDEALAFEIANQLEVLNLERRAIEAMITQEAILMVENSNQANSPIIILGKKGWHPGVIGIVASRIKDKFSKPTIIIGSADENDEMGKGSGRSIDGINLGALIKTAVDDKKLLSGGGHAMAAGLSVPFEQIDDFAKYCCDYLERNNAIDIETSIKIDCVVSVAALTIETLNSVQRLEPFGAGWPEPCFIIKNAQIFAANVLNGGHIRGLIKDDSEAKINFICFGAAKTNLGDGLLSKRHLDLIIRLKLDEWRGNSKVQAEIIDACYAIGG